MARQSRQPSGTGIYISYVMKQKPVPVFQMRITGCTSGPLMVKGSRDERVTVAINTVTRDETRWKGCAEYNMMKCDPKFLHNSTYPYYYGLIYEMNRYYLEELGLGYVNDGARSLTEHSNILGFLIEKFNFRRAYGRVQIAYQWWFGIIVKVLYPFRRWIKHPQVRGILRLEEVRRGVCG